MVLNFVCLILRRSFFAGVNFCKEKKLRKLVRINLLQSNLNYPNLMGSQFSEEGTIGDEAKLKTSSNIISWSNYGSYC